MIISGILEHSIVSVFVQCRWDSISINLGAVGASVGAKDLATPFLHRVDVGLYSAVYISVLYA